MYPDVWLADTTLLYYLLIPHASTLHWSDSRQTIHAIYSRSRQKDLSTKRMLRTKRKRSKKPITRCLCLIYFFIHHAMLKELINQHWIDAHAVIIKITEQLIDQYWRKTLDKYNYNGDKLIAFLRKNNQNYDTLINEYYHLHWFAY